MSIAGLTVALLTIALVPVDVFMVASLKQADGTFQEWATESVVDNVKTITTDAYYAFYALSVALAWVFMPMAYFFFEEKDEEMQVGTVKRCLGACKFTFVFLLVLTIILCIGAFALTSDGSADCTDDFNATDYKQYVSCRAEYAEKVLTSDGGKSAISFTIGILCVLGYVWLAVYTATGMVAMPINMIRSRGRLSAETDNVDAARDDIRQKQSKLDNKYGRKGGRKGRKKMSGRDNRRMLDMKEQDRVINRAVDRAREAENGCCGKMSRACRPFEWLFGVLFFFLSLFFAVCLTMTSADKLSQMRDAAAGTGEPVDYKHGYTNTTVHFNPIDAILTATHSVFPIDYVILICIVYYFVIATISGIKMLGVRFCHLKMYKIRPGRTVPQGLLFLVFILLFVILAFNVMLLTLAPTYVTYGDQQYPVLNSPLSVKGERTCDALAQLPGPKSTFPGPTKQCGPDAPGALYMLKYNSTGNNTRFHTDVAQLIPFTGKGEDRVRLYADNWGPCNLTVVRLMLNHTTSNTVCGDASRTLLDTLNVTSMPNPGELWCRQRNDPCTQTRMSAIVNAMFFKAWFLGAIYYWANWLFLVVFFLSFVYQTCKRRKSLMQVMVNDLQGDFDDSDDDMLPAKFSWA